MYICIYICIYVYIHIYVCIHVYIWKRDRFNRYTARIVSSVDFIYRDFTVTFLLVITIMLIGAGDSVI